MRMRGFGLKFATARSASSRNFFNSFDLPFFVRLLRDMHCFPSDELTVCLARYQHLNKMQSFVDPRGIEPLTSSMPWKRSTK